LRRARKNALCQESDYLSTVSADGFDVRTRAFREGLRHEGYIEGDNVIVEYRWAENNLDRLPALAKELVQRRVSVLVASGGTAGPMAAQATGTTIPIVFGIAEDPVQLGLVASLAHPGGNMTGVNLFAGELGKATRTPARGAAGSKAHRGVRELAEY
jgi:ABC-type uncharacterized transport system substrate-binding protein